MVREWELKSNILGLIDPYSDAILYLKNIETSLTPP